MAAEADESLSFEDDQDRFDNLPTEYKEHLMKAFAHKAGIGPDPGRYTGPQPEELDDEDADLFSDEITEADLQRAREEMPEEEGAP
jgi:hypothetical protein